MVAYNFQARFVAPIRAGTKRQTIRAPRQRHARPGETMQLYVAQRTPACELIAAVRCLDVGPVILNVYAGELRYGLGWVRTSGGLDAFAQADGFTGWSDLIAFWHQHHPNVPMFTGLLIRWEPLP